MHHHHITLHPTSSVADGGFLAYLANAFAEEEEEDEDIGGGGTIDNKRCK